MDLARLLKPAADNMLTTLDGLLAKAADNGGDALLEARLAPDMLPLAAQVRIACDQVSMALKRVSDSTFSLSDDPDTTIAAARQRVAGTKAALAAQADAGFVTADKQIELSLPNGMSFAMPAEDYLVDWAIAQLTFHVSIAYAILRMKGLEIGKRDFLPYMFRHVSKGAGAPAA
ncbi:DUF1993 family protein [Parablastomonas sp. CN1-191]|uniref:DUF1993 family protein n=1 Tax=Parablastomonas sp. CN1-191 TaxID=3400908 RepID=UPI003BF8A67B